MRKIINWMRRWSLALLIVIVGAGYLTVYDYWTVYAEPLYKLQEWWKAETVEGAEADAPAVSEAEGQEGSRNQAEASAESSAGAQENADTQEAADRRESADAQENAGAQVNAEGQENVGAQENAKGQESAGAQINAEGQENVGAQEAEERRSPEDVEYLSVEDDYFADAVFIGDSRTVGLYEYGELEEISTFYASTGLTIYKLFDAPIVETEGQKQKKTVEEALRENTFSKIYLMIGINEMGTGTVDSFMETYAQAVERLRELQPDAAIYLQGIMKVTAERSEKGDYITNEGIEERNKRIEELADYVHIYYLDVNPLICDETGGMEPSYTYDGVHLKARYISIWKDYLKSHAVGKLLLD